MAPVMRGFFERTPNRRREEQNRSLLEIERLPAGNRAYMGEGVQILKLARNAQKLVAKQEPPEKRRLLSFLLSTYMTAKTDTCLR